MLNLQTLPASLHDIHTMTLYASKQSTSFFEWSGLSPASHHLSLFITSVWTPFSFLCGLWTRQHKTLCGMKKWFHASGGEKKIVIRSFELIRTFYDPHSSLSNKTPSNNLVRYHVYVHSTDKHQVARLAEKALLFLLKCGFYWKSCSCYWSQTTE